MSQVTTRLRALYDGDTDRAHRFRYGLLAFDMATILFVVVSSFWPVAPVVLTVDIVVGIAVLTDLVARLRIAEHRPRELLHLSTWADIASVVAFLAPVLSHGAGFLRILRTLRLLRTFRVVARLRADSAFFRANEEVVLAVTNLFVFIFVMTGIVYATQHGSNPAIRHYIGALYFTVTSLTTTGYGDVTLPGAAGRVISVVMICGVPLFLRLAQVLFRPHKVRFTCPVCSLLRHDPDAVHCKACGTVLNIPNDGY